MSSSKKELTLKDEPGELTEVSCEIEIGYDGNNPIASRTDELHSLGLDLVQPNETATSDCDESESERHYIRFDDDEDQFYSSESDNVEENAREEIDTVEEGMMLIFQGEENSEKGELQTDNGLPYKEVLPLSVKEEVVSAEQSNTGRPRPAGCQFEGHTDASVQEDVLTNAYEACSSATSDSEWQLGPNDRFASIASSENVVPIIVVVRNADSERPTCEPVKVTKAKLAAKAHKTRRKRAKVPPSPAGLFPRICLKDTSPLNCVLCNIECSNRRSLIEHVKSHSTDKKSFECPTCGKTFTQQCNLKRHMRRHSGERPHSCPHCPKSFADRGYLTTHLRYHTDTRPYSCPHCPKSFFDRSNHVKHLKSHSGERPYPCPTCNKCFLQQSDLTRHGRVHSGERPFRCLHCARSFTQHGDLTNHVRRHTGERPYACPECRKTFANRRYLNGHVRGRICLKGRGGKEAEERTRPGRELEVPV